MSITSQKEIVDSITATQIEEITSFLKVALSEEEFNRIKDAITERTTVIFPENSLKGATNIPKWIKTSPFVEDGKYIIANK